MRTTLLQRWLVIVGLRSGSDMQERIFIVDLWREERSKEMICWQEGERRVVVIVAVLDMVMELEVGNMVEDGENCEGKALLRDIGRFTSILPVIYSSPLVSVLDYCRIDGTVAVGG